MIKQSLSVVTIILFISFQTYSQAGRTPVPAKNGMVVSAHFLASEVGEKILEKGGNAIDAAVATAFALAVTYPGAGNIGGGGFLVYYGHDGLTTSFNFREKAPLAARVDMYLDENKKLKKNSNLEGLLSVGVPGTVAGLFMAHKKLGKLKWQDLLSPAIELAEKGCPTSWFRAAFLEFIRTNKNKFPSTASVFLKNGQDLYNPGEIWKQQDLANSLKRIQKYGPDGFYKGETARLIVDFMKANGGLITREDLELYRAEELMPVHGVYRGYDIYSMAPPSSGGILLIEMLNMLEGFDLKKMGHNSAMYLHILTEVMRRAYADRAEFLGDPNFNKTIPVKKLISKTHAEKLRSTINWFQSSVSDSSLFSAAHLINESNETTHLSVTDKEGNAVSLTYTLGTGFGSKIVVAGAGFLLNNEMSDFNAIPGITNSKGQIGTGPNLIAPEKRMLSSMAPTIVVKEAKPVVVIGTEGGRSIPNTVVQILLNIIEHKMNIGEAIEAPRIHHQWLPDSTSFYGIGISPDTKRLYEMMGHPVIEAGYRGLAMGIFIDRPKGIVYGAADTRSFEGKAVGY